MDWQLGLLWVTQMSWQRKLFKVVLAGRSLAWRTLRVCRFAVTDGRVNSFGPKKTRGLEYTTLKCEIFKPKVCYSSGKNTGFSNRDPNFGNLPPHCQLEKCLLKRTKTMDYGESKVDSLVSSPEFGDDV